PAPRRPARYTRRAAPVPFPPGPPSPPVGPPPALLWLPPSPPPEAPRLAADLVLLGGRVWTGEGALPQAEAVAVREGRIVAVGTDADVKALVGSKTRQLALGGRRGVPGVIDSPVHLLGSGLRLSHVAL